MPRFAVDFTRRPVNYPTMAGDDARERLIKAGLRRLHATGYAATGIGEKLFCAVIA